MPVTDSFDIIVIGAGCAGLSFVEALNQLDQTKRILVLEQATSLSEIPKTTMESSSILSSRICKLILDYCFVIF